MGEGGAAGGADAVGAAGAVGVGGHGTRGVALVARSCLHTEPEYTENRPFTAHTGPERQLSVTCGCAREAGRVR